MNRLCYLNSLQTSLLSLRTNLCNTTSSISMASLFQLGNSNMACTLELLFLFQVLFTSTISTTQLRLPDSIVYIFYRPLFVPTSILHSNIKSMPEKSRSLQNPCQLIHSPHHNNPQCYVKQKSSTASLYSLPKKGKKIRCPKNTL